MSIQLNVINKTHVRVSPPMRIIAEDQLTFDQDLSILTNNGVSFDYLENSFFSSYIISDGNKEEILVIQSRINDISIRNQICRIWRSQCEISRVHKIKLYHFKTNPFLSVLLFTEHSNCVTILKHELNPTTCTKIERELSVFTYPDDTNICELNSVVENYCKSRTLNISSMYEVKVSLDRGILMMTDQEKIIVLDIENDLTLDDISNNLED